MTAVDHTVATLVAEDIATMDAWIAQQLHSPVALIEQIGRYILQAGGKRLRPSLLLLMSQALGCQNPQRHNLAAVVEFIHTATLLHDDVVDESSLRRGKATANTAFGNAASVLVGDFLYSRAFQMMVQCGDMRVMQILADATNCIAEGEVMQLIHTRDASLSLEQYRAVIHSKTARLFEASCELAAVLAGSDAATTQACTAYGHYLGMAFQMVDDVLDYTGVSSHLGKNLGDDLRESKMTLPLIVAMQQGDAADQALIRRVIETPWDDAAAPPMALPQALADILAVLERTGAVSASAAIAQAEAERASACLAPLTPLQAAGAAARAAHIALVQLPLSLLNRQV